MTTNSNRGLVEHIPVPVILWMMVNFQELIDAQKPTTAITNCFHTIQSAEHKKTCLPTWFCSADIVLSPLLRSHESRLEARFSGLRWSWDLFFLLNVIKAPALTHGANEIARRATSSPHVTPTHFWVPKNVQIRQHLILDSDLIIVRCAYVCSKEAGGGPPNLIPDIL